MADVIPFSAFKNAEKRGSPNSEQTLAADAALGDVARALRMIVTDEAGRHGLAELSARLLALLPLVEHEHSGTQALDELYEAARRLVYDRETSPQLVNERSQGLYTAYGAFRTQVAAASGRNSPTIAML